MHTVAGAVTGRVARLLLLACTLLGLAAMHTIGHHGVTHTSHVPSSATVDHDTPGVQKAVMAGAAVMGASGGCPGDDCGHLSAPPAHPGPGMPSLGLCIAVLGGFTVAVLLVALLFAALKGWSPAAPGAAWRATAPRAPPARPVGLILATVSVLRT